MRLVRVGALMALVTGCTPARTASPSTEATPATAPGRVEMPAMRARVLDDFERLDGWTAQPSDGVTLAIRSDSGARGRAMRLDFDFQGGGGYAVARKAIPLALDSNYTISFRIRGVARPNNLEFKLVDASGDNVWWVNRRAFAFPDDWREVTIRKRHIEFAWGPAGGGAPRDIASIEIAITAGEGGAGSVWIDELTYTPMSPVVPYAGTPLARASSSAAGSAPAAALDADSLTAWLSAPGERESWLELDFGQVRELGGLTVDWDSADFALSYRVEILDPAGTWAAVRRVIGGDGGRDHLFLPETETRKIRLVMYGRQRGVAIRTITVQPLAYAASRNAFVTTVAREAAPGSYPKYLQRVVQSYWTLVGVDGDDDEALMNEEGMLEVDESRFSIEPFLQFDDRLTTWADVTTVQSLERRSLPIPSVRWDGAGLSLTVTAFADGTPGASCLVARYRVRNTGAERRRGSLHLALRPFQVNPSWQFLSVAGGVAPVRALRWGDGVVRVDADKTVIPLTPPTAFGASTFDGGDIVEHIRRGRVPAASDVSDDFGAASGALTYALDLAPGAERNVYVAVPFHTDRCGLGPAADDRAAAELGERKLVAAIAGWEERLGRMRITLPPASEHLAHAVRSNLAFILINRDGPRIQPGSRSYKRSWIRDGSLTSAAMLRLGHDDEVRAFAEWYAPFQYPSGKVPCCVDARGADPVPEHDSHGQLIYLVMEYFRHTGDRAFLERMWPHIAGAVAYIDSLRRQRLTPEYESGELRAFRGLVPQSISHEGYSAKPMHSFWDDAFVLRGLKDAAAAAAVLGRPERPRYEAMRDEFRGSVNEAYRLTMARHGIDYLPGSVELGDFDATSTTVAVAPGGEEARLPQLALARTFARYFEFFTARRDGRASWEAYTPYEHRVVGTLVRLGEKARAHQVLDFLMGDRRPAAWNGWAEVVWRDPSAPKFIGDMPHTWVGSDYIRSVLDFFAYERESDSSLVVGAGVTEAWATSATGAGVQGLSTPFGTLDFTMRGDARTVRVRLAGDVRVPPGGIVVRSPMERAPRSATVGGRATLLRDGSVVVRRLPAEVVLRY